MPQSFSITDIGLRREMNQDYVFSSLIMQESSYAAVFFHN